MAYANRFSNIFQRKIFTQVEVDVSLYLGNDRIIGGFVVQGNSVYRFRKPLLDKRRGFGNAFCF